MTPGATMSARMHHYLFAHRALPALLWHDPAGVPGVLLSPQAGAFLVDFWNHVGKQLDEAERLAAEGLACAVHDLGDGYRAAVITLPAPERIIEAYLVAVVFRAQPGAEPAPRYFTLEKGVNLESDTPRAVLCEWTRDGAHCNFGDGPAPEPAAFAAALRRLLQPRPGAES